VANETDRMPEPVVLVFRHKPPKVDDADEEGCGPAIDSFGATSAGPGNTESTRRKNSRAKRRSEPPERGRVWKLDAIRRPLLKLTCNSTGIESKALSAMKATASPPVDEDA
jgi:hypothetical protein